MTLYQFNFDGPDTGYGAIVSGIDSFQAPSGGGQWARLSNRLVASTAPALFWRSFSYWDLEVAVDVANGGGDAVVARGKDASNYVAARIVGLTDNEGPYHKIEIIRVQGGTIVQQARAIALAHREGETDPGAAPITRLRLQVIGNEAKAFANQNPWFDVALTLTNQTTTYAGSNVGIARSVASDGATGSSALDNLSVQSLWSAPFPPTLVAPAYNGSIETTQAYTFRWTFNDEDPGDYQTWANLRYRLVGDYEWTTLNGVSPYSEVTPGTDPQWTAAADTFPVGDYEWQVQTSDRTSRWSGWSATGRFTSSAVGALPVITAPADSATITTSEVTLTWTVDDQDAYQVRVLADASGAPNEDVNLWDTGEVAAGATRSQVVPLPTNFFTQHIQVRVKKGSGLWTGWSSVRVSTNFAQPTAPVVSAAPDGVAIDVSYRNPSGGNAVARNDIYVTEDGVERRVATGLAPTDNAVHTWTYQTPMSGVDYSGQIRVVAVGTLGPTISSIVT